MGCTSFTRSDKKPLRISTRGKHAQLTESFSTFASSSSSIDSSRKTFLTFHGRIQAEHDVNHQDFKLVCAMQLDDDTHLSDDQLAMYTSPIGEMSYVPRHKCHVCERHPTGNEDFPRCAKCRMLVYCSRECQKRDWPIHKLSCSEPDKAERFVLKSFGRINLDIKFNRYLQTTLTEDFFDVFSQTPNADRKMWVFALNVFLCPIKKEHIAALSSHDIPLAALLNRSMVGELMASKLVDISDQAKDRLEPRMCEAWQKLRDSADSSGITTIVTVVIFKYLGTQFFASYNPIFPRNFVEVRRQRELARNAQKEFPDPVRHIDRWLRDLKDSKGGKLVCPLGDLDKKFFRTGDLAAESSSDDEFEYI